MRRFLCGALMASITAAAPAWALGGDREIAQAVLSELEHFKQAGQLKGFDVNIQVDQGVVYLSGEVANHKQRTLITAAAANAVGVNNVVNDIFMRTTPATPTSQAVGADRSNDRVAPASTSPTREDIAVTDLIYDKLAWAKSAGKLRGFELDISTIHGDVWLRGSVATEAQKTLVLDVARHTPGVSRVIDEISISGANRVQPASADTPQYPMSAGAPQPVPPSPVPTSQRPIPQAASMPVMGHPMPTAPQPFAPSGLASHMVRGGAVVNNPAPMQYGGAEIGMGAPRYDQPNLPNYAWPSYAAYPNYAAVTYPKQYSPSAWPYIGPFYPYPQVPLGWRKVCLQWDDGLWYLDFTSK
ncbi:MAG: BON domain-containing protein [Pirellulaceae bacterium]|nr:BON domain-containing protein [Pirellulaceae bacterium]